MSKDLKSIPLGEKDRSIGISGKTFDERELKKFSDDHANERKQEKSVMQLEQLRSNGSEFGSRFTGQGITDEPNPLLSEEHGFWENDLAYSRPLRLMTNSVMEGDETANITGLLPGFSEDEFKPASECLKMLEDEERNYDGIEEVTEEELKSLAKTYGLSEEGWLATDRYQSEDFQDEYSMDAKRVSIGTFLGMGSEDLGSLDGKLASSRPVIFSHDVESPPSDRQPKALCRRPSIFTTGSNNNGSHACNQPSSLSDPMLPAQFRSCNSGNLYAPSATSDKGSLQTTRVFASNRLQGATDALKPSTKKLIISPIKGQTIQNTDIDIRCHQPFDNQIVAGHDGRFIKSKEFATTDSKNIPLGCFSETSISILDVSKFVDKMKGINKKDVAGMILQSSNAKWSEDGLAVVPTSRESLLPGPAPKVDNKQSLGFANNCGKAAGDTVGNKFGGVKAGNLQTSNKLTRQDNGEFKVPLVPKRTEEKSIQRDKGSEIKVVTRTPQNALSSYNADKQSFGGRISSTSTSTESRVPSIYFKADDEEIFDEKLERNRFSVHNASARQSLQSRTSCVSTGEERNVWTMSAHESRGVSRKLNLSNIPEGSQKQKHPSETAIRHCDNPIDRLPTSKVPLTSFPIPIEGAKRSKQQGSENSNLRNKDPPCKGNSSSSSSPSSISSSIRNVETFPNPVPSNYNPGNRSRPLSRNSNWSEASAEGRIPLGTVQPRQHSSISSSTDLMVPLKMMADCHDTTLDETTYHNYVHHQPRKQEQHRRSPRQSRGSSPSSSVRSSTNTLKNLRLKPVEVDQTFNLPQVCCMGLTTVGRITVMNPNQFSIKVETLIRDVTVNGMVVDPSVIRIREKFGIEATKSKELKVVFSPRVAGVHRWDISFNITSPGYAHSICSVSATSEKPQIEITTFGSSMALNQVLFQSVPWGSHQLVSLNVKNKGQSIVTLTVSVSTLAERKCFCIVNFVSDQTDSDLLVTESITFKLHPAQELGLSPDSNLRDMSDTMIDDDHSSEKKLSLLFQAPEESESGSMGILNFSGNLKAEVHNPNIHIPVLSIPLIAEVGSIRLRINKEVIHLKNDEGDRNPLTHLALVNNGSIMASISLVIKSGQSPFSVCPPHVMVEPGGRTEVIVTFDTTRLQRGTRVEDRLTVKVQEGSHTFDVFLRGEVVNDPGRSKPLMMASHWSVFWSASQARINDGIQTVTLYNRGDKGIKIKLELRGATAFKLVTSSDRKIETCQSRIIVIMSGGDFPVALKFEPTESRFYMARLIMTEVNGAGRYKIPLSAYGGESNLVIEDVNLTPSGQYVSPVEELDDAYITEIILRNDGRRSCYIRAIPYKDREGALQCNEASVTPNMFCLQKNERQKVMIMMPLSNHEDNFVGLVQFHHGDEINRQLHRRFLGGSRNILGADFSVEFANEEMLTDEEKRESESLSSPDQFYSSVKKESLLLICENSAETTSNFASLNSQNDNTSDGHLTQQVTPSRLSMQQQTEQQFQTQPSNEFINILDVPALLNSIQLPEDFVRSICDIRITPEERQELLRNMRIYAQKSDGNLNIASGLAAMRFGSPPIRDHPSQESTRRQPATTGHTEAKREWIVRPKNLELVADGLDKNKFFILNQSDETLSFRIESCGLLHFSVASGEVLPRSEISVTVWSLHRQGMMNVELPWTGDIQVTRTDRNSTRSSQSITIKINPGND